MRRLLLTTAILMAMTCVNAQSNGNQEEIGLRDMYSKTYVLPDNQHQAIINGAPIHYFNGLGWEDIDLSLIETGNSFLNASNVFETEFPKDADAHSFVNYLIDGHEIKSSMMKEFVSFDNVITVHSMHSQWGDPLVQGQELKYTEQNSGVQDVYQIANGEVKNNVVLQQLPDLSSVSSSAYVGFRERLYLPSGWKLESVQSENNSITSQGIMIIDDNNEGRLMIPAPIIYDGNGMENNGSNASEAAFVIEEVNGVWYLSTLVPVSWLNAQERVFPVTFDPTITFVGNTGGWQSQNNFVNNSGYVFIGVCCGNLEHRAWIKWSVSAIPANSCVTAADLQIYVNGVGASTAELVHVFDMMETTSMGIFGPYATINNAVYLDQATGYHCSFTITGVGYYGWYDLGANAYADIQTMANTYGWYQLALIFDNEPSTNWKRLTATMCSIRITYQDPPCAPLPVKLATFDVSCENEQAKVEWETASETNNDFFTVWRSEDGEVFTPVGRVDGLMNSNQLVSYDWTDDETIIGSSYYRLSQTDLNGVSEYFEPRVFYGCSIAEPIVSTDQMDKVRVEGESIQSVIIYDQMGRKLLEHSNENHAEKIVLDPAVQKGFYIVKISHHDGNVSTENVYLEK